MTYCCKSFAHHEIDGMHWHVRRFQNPDGSYTEEGRKRYGIGEGKEKKKMSTGAKVAIGAGIAAAAGAVALIATGKYKEIPDLVNRGKEKVQMALVKAGKGELVYGKKEWEKQLKGVEKTKLSALSGALHEWKTDRKAGNVRRVTNDPWLTIIRAKTGMTSRELYEMAKESGSLTKAAAKIDDIRRSKIYNQKVANIISMGKKRAL